MPRRSAMRCSDIIFVNHLQKDQVWYLHILLLYVEDKVVTGGVTVDSRQSLDRQDKSQALNLAYLLPTSTR